MKSSRAAQYRVAVLGLLVLGGGWWALRPTPTDSVAYAAKTLAAALARPDESASTSVSTHVCERLTINVGGTRRELARSELAAWVAKSISTQGLKRIALENLEIRVVGRRAHLEARAVSSETQYGDLHAEERPIVAEFELQEDWRLRTLTLAPAAKYLPEARP